jgi:hypothetical protein
MSPDVSLDSIAEANFDGVRNLRAFRQRKEDVSPTTNPW